MIDNPLAQLCRLGNLRHHGDFYSTAPLRPWASRPEPTFRLRETSAPLAPAGVTDALKEQGRGVRMPRPMGSAAAYPYCASARRIFRRTTRARWFTRSAQACCHPVSQPYTRSETHTAMATTTSRPSHQKNSCIYPLLLRISVPASRSTPPGPLAAPERPEGVNLLHMLALRHNSSVGRTNSSLTAMRRGRVTMYPMASAMSSAAIGSTPARRCSNC